MKNMLLSVTDETARKFKEIQNKFTSEMNKNLNQNDAFAELVERFHQGMT